MVLGEGTSRTGRSWPPAGFSSARGAGGGGEGVAGRAWVHARMKDGGWRWREFASLLWKGSLMSRVERSFGF